MENSLDAYDWDHPSSWRGPASSKHRRRPNKDDRTEAPSLHRNVKKHSRSKIVLALATSLVVVSLLISAFVVVFS